jgi:hypothetical protein
MRRLSSLKFFFIVLFLHCIYQDSFSQIDQQSNVLKNVIGPSPNAASLGKYADWPVNLYTGVPQIDIPIYEIKGRSLSVPISLSYHGSGIKVGENASCVGLGFSLQAGGVITRSVRGLADDDQGPGYLTIRSYYNNPGDLSSGTLSTYNNSAFCDSMLEIAIANGNADSQPDLFMFSALGRSYKFFFSGNGTIVTQPYSNLKITYNATAGSFTVIMEDGTKLLFGGSSNFEELTNVNDPSQSYGPYQTSCAKVVTGYSGGTSADAFISAWYLQSITSATGEVISFTYYTSGSVTLDTYFSESDFAYYSTPINNLTVGVPVTTKTAKTVAQTTSINMLTVATIESDLCKVYFDTSSRSDLPGGVAISGIRVFSKQQNKTIRSFLLNYGYSTATSSNTYTGGYSTPPYRLKLSSLEEVPSDNGRHRIWQFAYNPLTLPSRKSFAQDYWGYYNGATGNTTLKPYVYGFNPYVYSTANRSADSASMMAEMLTQVTYPTGGYSQFTYEPNSYPANEEQFQNTPVSQSLYMTYNQSNFTNKVSTTFTLTKPQYFQFNFTSQFSTVYMQDYGSSTNLTFAKLTGPVSTTLTFNKTENNTTKTATLYLTPGTYTLTDSSISPQTDFGSTSQWVSMSSSYAYAASLGVQAINHKVGGVRVKRIAYFDNVDNTKSIIKNYSYQGANVVSPIDTANDFVVFTTDNLYDCNGTPNNITACSCIGCIATSVIYYERNAVTKFALGSIQGGTVGYSTVTESIGATGQGGRTVYNYVYTSDANIASSKGLPYPATISYDYERGLLQEKDTYTAGNKLTSRSLNTYQFVNRNAITAFKVGYKTNIGSSCFSFNYIGDFLTRVFYQDKADQVKRSTSTEIAYNTDTGDSLVTTTNYYYDDTLNMQPIRSVTFNSKGDSVVTYSRTALEKSAINSSITLSSTAATAIDTMLARNIVGIPLESEKYTKSILTNKALSNYKLQTNGYVEPDNVMVQNASNPLESRVQFNRYDQFGNLLEQQKVSDLKHTYIWDYQKTYPVAEVVNADSANIAYTSFEADGSGNWSIGSTMRDTITAGVTGTKSYILSNGTISKSGLTSGRYYRVSYWTRNAAAYTITGTQSGYPVQGKTINGWTYFEHRITGQTSVTLSGSGNIDELRLYPDSAQMVSYTFIPLIGINSQCDINNRVAYYQFDGFGNLYVVKDQDGNAIKKYCYSYFGTNNACIQYYNVAKSQTFTRNNCGSGYTGGTVTYTVAANTYASLISQGAADTLALNDIAANGQNYANTNGTCNSSGVTITSTNYAGVSGFTATFTNTANGNQTVFSIPASGGTLGTLTPATYNVTIAKSGNTTQYVATVCSSMHAVTSSYTFFNMSISSTCNTVTLDSPQ